VKEKSVRVDGAHGRDGGDVRIERQRGGRSPGGWRGRGRAVGGGHPHRLGRTARHAIVGWHVVAATRAIEAPAERVAAFFWGW
jgi:hypothetical protein